MATHIELMQMLQVADKIKNSYYNYIPHVRLRRDMEMVF